MSAATARLLLIALLVIGQGGIGAEAAEFDLCVRGTSLEETLTARLVLTVTGADVGRIAPQLGAAVANHRYWADAADDVYGSPFDADLCGETVAPRLEMSVVITPGAAATLETAIEHGDVSALRAAVATLPGAAPPAPLVHRKGLGDLEPDVGEPVVDAGGRVRYHLMRVYYATDRQRTAESAPDRHFGGDRGPLSFGVVNVALPRAHQRGRLESPSILRLEFSADPEKHVVLESLTELGVDRWRAEVAKRAAALGNPGILVFVHGYDTDFGDAALRAGQLAFDLKFGGATVLFSWPSRGSMLDYTADEQSAEWSVPDMQAVLDSIATLAPGTPVYVIAHSMGNRVATRAFKAMLEKDRSRAASFRELVLAAPDVDADVFRREIGPAILGMGPRVTLYASSNDKALAASRSVHGGYHRLGESGNGLVVLKNLDTVDASTVSTEMLGHSYYGDSGTVMSDLMYLIRKSLPAQDRERFALERVTDAAVGLYWRFKTR